MMCFCLLHTMPHFGHCAKRCVFMKKYGATNTFGARKKRCLLLFAKKISCAQSVCLKLEKVQLRGCVWNRLQIKCFCFQRVIMFVFALHLKNVKPFPDCFASVTQNSERVQAPPEMSLFNRILDLCRTLWNFYPDCCCRCTGKCVCVCVGGGLNVCAVEPQPESGDSWPESCVRA